MWFTGLDCFLVFARKNSNITCSRALLHKYHSSVTKTKHWLLISVGELWNDLTTHWTRCKISTYFISLLVSSSIYYKVRNLEKYLSKLWSYLMLLLAINCKLCHFKLEAIWSESRFLHWILKKLVEDAKSLSALLPSCASSSQIVSIKFEQDIKSTTRVQPQAQNRDYFCCIKLWPTCKILDTVRTCSKYCCLCCF